MSTYRGYSQSFTHMLSLCTPRSIAYISLAQSMKYSILIFIAKYPHHHKDDGDILVSPAGLEPATLSLKGRRSTTELWARIKFYLFPTFTTHLSCGAPFFGKRNIFYFDYVAATELWARIKF